MSAFTRTSAGVGDHAYGSGAFGEEFSISGTNDDALSSRVRSRGQYGFYAFGQRYSGRTYEWAPRSTPTSEPGGAVSIVITSSSGAILGRIRTDVKEPLLEKITFKLDRNGCADFTMTLNAIPDFPLLPMSIITINIGNTDFDWYRGTLLQGPEEGTPRDHYVYTGFGLRKEINRLTGERIFPAPLDVGEIVDALTSENIAPYSNVNYNPSKIVTSTGVLTASDNDLSKAKLNDTLGMYEKMASHRWGVDGDGDLYFENRSQTVQRVWFVGFDVQDFEPDLDTDTVRNSIIVKRQEGKGSGGAGWSVVTVENDDTSIGKYGLKELEYQMKGFFGDEECQLVGESLLEELKEPKYTANVSGIQILSGEDFLPRGVHRFINLASRFTVEADSGDTVTQWNVINPTTNDLDISVSTSVYVSGLGSLKMGWQSATNSRIEKYISFSGSAKKIRAWVRGTRTGQLATFGIGFGAWDHNTRSIDVPTTGVFIPFEWDITDLNVTQIDTIGIRVDNSDGSDTSLYIDRIEIEAVGCKHYDMELTTVTYEFSPSAQIAKAEFGPPPMKMYDYIASVMAQVEENKFVGEQR